MCDAVEKPGAGVGASWAEATDTIAKKPETVPMANRCANSAACSADKFCSGLAAAGGKGKRHPHGECAPCEECHYDHDEIDNECPKKCGGAQRGGKQNPEEAEM